MAYGFSKTQSVLDNETWESLRIVNEQSPTTKLVSEKLREIVTRLLSKSAGQYNINDFEFLVSDNKDIINAFFINSLHTKNGKNVIGITPELIRFCETENELAAVIAHELGHFTYGKLFAYDENSVFQERASDLYAVNLLIDGGFNPYAYRNVAERLFLKSNYKSTTNALAALDIHGGDFARVEDVEIYMTKLKKERGFLPSGNEFDNGKWRIFQNQFERALSHDHFKSYVEQTWGNKKLTENNIDDFLDFIRTGMESGQLHSECRLQDCAEKLAEYTDRIPKPETSEKTLGKIQQLTPYFCKKSTITKRDASFLVLDALCVITSPTKFYKGIDFAKVSSYNKKTDVFSNLFTRYKFITNLVIIVDFSTIKPAVSVLFYLFLYLLESCGFSICHK